MDFTLEQLSEAYASLTDAEKEAFNKANNLVINKRKNHSWKETRTVVRRYIEEHKSFSLDDLKQAGIIPKKTTGQQFRRCVTDKLREGGFDIRTQMGVLKRNAPLYHLEGHEISEVKFSSVFESPSREAATYLVEVLVNGQAGNLDFRKPMTKKQFPFMSDKKSMNTFRPLLYDEAGKHGWRFGSKPFVGTKEVKV